MLTIHRRITSPLCTIFLYSFTSFPTKALFSLPVLRVNLSFNKVPILTSLLSGVLWLMSMTVGVKVSQEEEVSRLAEDCSLADLLHFDDTNNDGQLNLNEFYTAFSKLYSKLSCLPLPVTTPILPFHHVSLLPHPPFHPLSSSCLHAHFCFSNMHYTIWMPHFLSFFLFF